MSWKKVGNSRQWRRPAGGIESLMIKYYGLSFSHEYAEYHLSFSTQYQLQGSPELAGLSSDTLNEAWTALRFDIPDLCSSHDLHTGEIVYQVPDEANLEDWLKQTVRIRPASAEPDTDFWNLEHEKETSLYHYPHRSQLIIRGPHWKVDGIGIAMLTNRFFDHLEAALAGNMVKPIWSNEIDRLNLSLDEALQLPTPDQASSDIHAYADKQVQDLFGDRPSLGLPYVGDVDRQPGQPRMQAHVYSVDSTKMLIEACRSKSLTVTSAIHTALILQVYRLAASDRKSLHVVEGLPLDHRKYLSEPFNGSAFAMKTCVTTLPIRLPNPADESYEEFVRRVNNIYRNDFDISIQTRAWPTMYTRWDSLLDFKPPPGFPLPSSIMLSNSGILDDYLSASRTHVSITEADIFVEVVSRNSVMNVQTWADKIHLNLEYNEGYYSNDLMRSVLEGVKNLLEEGLGVRLKLEPLAYEVHSSP